MGINGLLKGLSPLLIPENDETSTKMIASKPMYNISQFKNKTIAVDASSWLYKACYCASERLVEAIEADRIDHVCEKILCKYMIKRCEELLTFAGIRRIRLVFDGKRCPLKAGTNKEREARRQRNLAEARRLSGLGMKDQALDKYKACVTTRPWMADSVAKAVAQKWKKRNGFISVEPQVTCFFSPYEADAQLVKLCMDGLADAVVTEDSDLLVYSAACMHSFPIIYKLDRNTGSCDVISMDWLLARSPSSQSLDYNGSLSIRRLLHSQLPSTKADSNNQGKKAAGGALLSHLNAIATRESRNAGSGARMFVQACVLSGCDYAPSRVSGVGLVTAFKMIKENIHRDPHCRFEHTLKSVSKDKFSVSDDLQDSNSNEKLRGDYEELMAKSECVFYFHRVLDQKGKVVPLVDSKKCHDSSVGASPIKMEALDYLPKLERFGDETFIGKLNVDGSEKLSLEMQQKIVPAKSSKSSKLPILKPTSNPYEKSKVPKMNIFSYYAHNATTNSSKRASSLESSATKSSSIRAAKSDSSSRQQQFSHGNDSSSDDELDDILQPIAKCKGPSSQKSASIRNEEDNQPSQLKIYPLSDDSSDDELDEVLQPIASYQGSDKKKRLSSKGPSSQKSASIRNEEDNQPSQLKIYPLGDDSSDDELDEVLQPIARHQGSDKKKRSHSFSSASLLSPLSSSKDDHDAEVSKSGSSKYFFSRDTTPFNEESTEPRDSNKPRTVTPTMANLRAKMDTSKARPEDLSDDDLLTPVSPHSMKAANPATSMPTVDDSSDDDDCVFIESSKPSNNRTTAINSRPSLSQSSSNSRSGTFSSTFAKAQGEGTRARLASRMRKMKPDTTKKAGRALGRPTKKARTASIKAFFT